MTQAPKPAEIPTLSMGSVSLRPLSQTDGEGLAALLNEETVRFFAADLHDKAAVDNYVADAISGFKQGIAIPFGIYHKEKLTGTTRLFNIDWNHRKGEIGHTIVAQLAWRTEVNTSCKLMLLSYAFEELDFERVCFQTDERNQRSRDAILRLGAQFEGLLRRDRIMPDGFNRNSAVYSIIRPEWPSVKESLENRLKKHR